MAEGEARLTPCKTETPKSTKNSCFKAGSDYTFHPKEENGLRVAVCDGTCLRSERPLSCRLFPFFPFMNSEGDIEAVIDTRGYGICPLTERQSKIKFNRRFLRSVRRVGRILYRDEDTFPFMKKISEEIEFQKELIEKLRG